MGTKNNPKNRKAVEKKKFNDKEVEPVLYHGVNAGHGKYIAVKYIGSSAAELISDPSGKPIQWEDLK
jgi:hypothetical protein